MAVRPSKILDEATYKSLEVAPAKTVTKGYRVKHSGADNLIENCGAGELGIGEALDDGAAGDKVRVILDGAVVPVVVGTGGATRGALAKSVADGMTDATAVAAGTTLMHSPGIFLESGVAGDQVGLIKSPRTITEA